MELGRGENAEGREWVGNLGQGGREMGWRGKDLHAGGMESRERQPSDENQQYLSSGEWVMEGQRLEGENEKNFHNPISTSKDLHVKDMEEFSCFDRRETTKIKTALDHKDTSLKSNGSHAIISFQAPWGPGLILCCPCAGGPDKEAHSWSDGDTVPSQRHLHPNTPWESLSCKMGVLGTVFWSGEYDDTLSF